ncbi:MAG: hypothetical protein ACO31I_10275 [Prochlorotrichaceae cyanobacterium]|jgi:uncharacterized protein (DUF697 family)
MSDHQPESDRLSTDSKSLDPEQELSAEVSALAEPSTEQPQSLWSVLGTKTQALKDSSKGAIEGTTKAIGSITSSAGQRATKATQTVGQTVGNVVEGAGKAIEASLTTATQVAGKTIGSTQKLVSETVTGTGEAIGSAVRGTGQTVGYTLQYTTQFTGQILHKIDRSPELQRLTQALNLEWLIPILNRVDIQGVMKTVEDLKSRYPQAPTGEIAHRLIQKKVLLVGGMGFASSLVPGVSTALFSVDMAGLVLSQAELGYQIAAVYGLDVMDPARKGEVLAIFGAAMGTNFALKTGLKFVLRSVPIAGSVVGASTNAMALYAVGYAACRFYESQGQALLSGTAAQAALESGSDYLEEAQQQQILVDQIIAQMVRASLPDRSWEEILPELEPYNLSEASLTTIETHLNNPVPLSDLIGSLSVDYGLVALSVCQAIADADQTITPAEEVILNALNAKLEQV